MRKVMESEDQGSEGEKRSGVQVFRYRTPECYEGYAIEGQPCAAVFSYHRPLSDILHQSFEAGFVLDAMEEPCFSGEEKEWTEIPPAMILRLRKPC